MVDSHIDPNSIEKNIFCQLQIPYQKIQKVLFKIYYTFVNFLLRTRVVVERSLLIPSQTSTFKWVWLQVILKDFPKLWENLHKQLPHIRYLMAFNNSLKLLLKRQWRSLFFNRASGCCLSPLLEVNQSFMQQ